MPTYRDQIDNESRSAMHNSRGIHLAERGFFDEAINEFKRAITNAPSSAQSYDNLGNVYADKGELLEALSSFMQALKLEPDNAIALHNLGCFLSNYGQKLAANCFKDAFEIEPDMHEAKFNLGLCFAAEEKHDQAIAQYETALQQDDDHEIRFHLALSYFAQDNYKKSIVELLRVVKFDNQHDQAWLYLGLSYQERGFLEEAVKALGKAVAINANNFDAIMNLASLLARLERKKECTALLKRAWQVSPPRTQEFMTRDEYLCHAVKLFVKNQK